MMTSDSDDRVFAVVLGGLGSPQTSDIAKALSRMDGVYVWTPSRVFDQFRADVELTVRLFPANTVVLVGHSFGAQRVLESCITVAHWNICVDYLVLIDPVAYEPLWSQTLAYPRGNAAPKICDIFRAANSFPVFPATINGGPDPIVVANTNHNSLCHSKTVITAIVDRVATLLKERV
ncbi:MAG: alpha/beta fold hydrolase [Phycisphaerales bacterium]|nr:alpha/beta fold hydrolase [Phycisphaerales bacterium]